MLIYGFSYLIGWIRLEIEVLRQTKTRVLIFSQLLGTDRGQLLQIYK